MRLALIAAFVGSLLFTSGSVEARPGKAAVASKQKAKKKAKKPAKKPARKEIVEEAPVIEEVAKPTVKEEPHRGGSVAQATDDEVPRNQPRKR